MSLNGVDTDSLFATIDAVKGQPDLAKFQFRVSNRWVSGTHNRSTINGYYGAGQEFARASDLRYDADHPRSSPAATRARPRSSSSCTPWPPVSPAAWRTSRPRGEGHPADRGDVHCGG